MYYVEIQGNTITGKGTSPDLKREDLLEGQEEVTKEIYDAILRLPATCTHPDYGSITDIVNAPEPEPIPAPPSLQEQIDALNAVVNTLLGV